MNQINYAVLVEIVPNFENWEQIFVILAFNLFHFCELKANLLLKAVIFVGMTEMFVEVCRIVKNSLSVM